MKKFIRYCQALDLVDDPELIKEYETIHQNIWPEIAQNIRDSGVLDMQIWRIGTRLFMIMDVSEQYSAEEAAKLAENNPIVQKWEEQMWKFQVPTPWTPDGEKWIPMTQIFSLQSQG